MLFPFIETENKVDVPGFEQTIKPILKALQENGGEASIAQMDKEVVRIMDLPEEVAGIKHKGSTKQSEIEYRIAWGRTYLKKYGFITNVSRGVWALTDKFDGNVDKIDVNKIVEKVRNESARSREEKTELRGFESALVFRNMALSMLQELAKSQGKRACLVQQDLDDCGYDLILPDGLDEEQGEIKCIIEYVSESKQSEADFYRRVEEKLHEHFKGNKILLITNLIMSALQKLEFGPNVLIWDKNDLQDRIEPEAPYAQYLMNPRQALIEDVVTANDTDQQKRNERENYLKQIKNAFRKQDMVLFLGAGVSIDGGIPLWATLIKTLHIYMLDRLTKDKALSFKQQEMINELARNNEMESPLAQMRYIKAAFSNEEYYELVHSALYSQPVNLDTGLLNAIAKISTPQRAYCGIKSIITYNFDDLLERKLEQRDIQYNTISNEGERQLVDKLNIYHVHGYLPNDFSGVLDEWEPNLIFSEEDYHKVYRDAYSWTNLVQLSALRENTCLFIGCSLTDPNLKRLLDVAARSGENPRHFAFLKKEKIKGSGEAVNKNILELYQKIDDNIQTAYYKQLGLNIIWIDDYEEIPVILNDFLC